MSLAQFADVTFGYPGREILRGASLLIRPGERIALVGPNGTGKSTALRLLTGEIAPDAGDARVLGRASVAYLRQSQNLNDVGRVMDAILEPFAALRAVHDQLATLEHRLADADPALLARYGELQERYAHDGGYELEARIKRLTADLGFAETDLQRPVATLSGGERGRLELAKVLVQKPDLLLLDEPTNHLDLAAIERLEGYLAEYSGAFVLVSHDRAFIKATCREIVELENGMFVRYPFAYEKYVAERAARLARLEAEYEKQREHVAKTEDFIRRNLAGQKTKQAQSRRKMLEKLERLERPDDQWLEASKMALRFSTGGELGSKETLRAPDLTVGYPDRTILAHAHINVYRGDRIGIVGPNGCGKSTLLKTLVGELAPLAGAVEIGSGVRIGYFDQKLGALNESGTLIDELRGVRADLSPDALRAYLAKFRFTGDDPFRSVRGLSGGERSRLAMAKMMLFPRNLLALDEPTNHLDIPARETLEDALADYDGTLLVVSHDRYFLDRVCRKMLVFVTEKDGTARAELHLGTYSEVRARRRESERTAPPAAPPPAPPSRAPAVDRDGARRAARERDAAALERQLEALEQELTAVRAALVADHGGNWAKLHELAARESTLSEQAAAIRVRRDALRARAGAGRTRTEGGRT